MEYKLHNFGILNESANFRAHVAPLAGIIYFFKTENAKKVMNNYKCVYGYQKQIKEPTALGYLVPPDAIEGIVKIKINNMENKIKQNMSTSEKGDVAVDIVLKYLKEEKFEAEFIKDKNIQKTGTDIFLKNKSNNIVKIEVKCDYTASDSKSYPNILCSGNLFLQIAENNILKKF